ncbi:hypothetical protein B0H67DRAFT_231236 [Lasiosphaeris hirsuta]|uniref:Uncharacterized protein n=1 Tax=Lasiosphaeris hirsuta TaxID=260670 RepID=A0AA40AFQ5_9PEZI|nr:hypothetical protein B0H67DRAFT_231236 [Lasiosphaeris hirsuta]
MPHRSILCTSTSGLHHTHPTIRGAFSIWRGEGGGGAGKQKKHPRRTACKLGCPGPPPHFATVPVLLHSFGHVFTSHFFSSSSSPSLPLIFGMTWQTGNPTGFWALMGGVWISLEALLFNPCFSLRLWCGLSRFGFLASRGLCGFGVDGMHGYCTGFSGVWIGLGYHIIWWRFVIDTIYEYGAKNE